MEPSRDPVITLSITACWRGRGAAGPEQHVARRDAVPGGQQQRDGTARGGEAPRGATHYVREPYLHSWDALPCSCSGRGARWLALRLQRCSVSW